jgi:hypothetical protein
LTQGHVLGHDDVPAAVWAPSFHGDVGAGQLALEGDAKAPVPGANRLARVRVHSQTHLNLHRSSSWFLETAGAGDDTIGAGRFLRERPA